MTVNATYFKKLIHCIIEQQDVNFQEDCDHIEVWLRWLPVAETSGFIFSYGIGMNLIPWLLVGELCPPHLRAISSSIAVTVCATCIFTVVKVIKI